MKQPIETLLTELAVLEHDLVLLRSECEDAEKELIEAKSNFLNVNSRRIDVLAQIATVKTQIAQANENS